MFSGLCRSHESGCNLGGKPPITLCKYETHKVIGWPRFNNYWGRKVTPKGKAGQHLIFQPMQSKMFPPVALFRVKIYIQEKKRKLLRNIFGVCDRTQESIFSVAAFRKTVYSTDISHERLV